jgi:putative radical SAM enzyme (TIGR03279 family)
VSVNIFSVLPDSPCKKKGIKEGDTLISINGHEITDVLDYNFYASDSRVVLEIKDKKGLIKKVKIKKDEYEDLGLEFETYLMDSQRHCSNKCIFCFIDQLPKGLRKSLYFKDDDSRLSFLFGNYITLTNLTDIEIDRIIKMHISPVNISVHTMNPSLRVKMMKNPNAAHSLEYIKKLADAGIKLNTQLVLCPGYNDGEELKFTLSELGKLYPSVQSIAAVPVGLTCHREGLCELSPFTPVQAADVIDIIDNFNSQFMRHNNERIAFPADEFYLKAGREMPSADYYGSFAQLENGVGLWANFKDEFFGCLNEAMGESVQSRKITVATGAAAYPLICELVDETVKKWHNLIINVIKIRNILFGESITVAGLLAGNDIINQLSGLDLGEELLIPSAALRREGDMFLDDVTVEQMSKSLRIKVTPVPNDGGEFFKALIGKK